MNDKFSVCQFFADGSYEYIKRWVGAEEAFEIAKQCTESIGAKTGATQRVIITDADDYCAFEWKFNEGVVFPVCDANNLFSVEYTMLSENQMPQNYYYLYVRLGQGHEFRITSDVKMTGRDNE